MAADLEIWTQWISRLDLELTHTVEYDPHVRTRVLRRLRLTSLAGLAVTFAVVGVPSALAAKGAPAWPAASRIALPPGAAAPAETQDQTPTLNSVACTSPGSCVAVGSYNDTRHSSRGVYDSQAMVVTEKRGVWDRASKLMLPAATNLPAGDQSASLASVVCTGPGSCVAVGSFTRSGGLLEPIVASETKGVWGRASEIGPPSNANATTANGVGLDSVACTSRGNCVAVGAYDDNGTGQQAMVVVEERGVWGPASKLMLPSNENTSPGDQDAGLSSVACTGPGSCVAVGSYADASGSEQPMIATEASGVWSQASELTLPAGALETTENFGECGTVSCAQYAVLSSVACTSPGSCVAAGFYADTTGSVQAMVVSETSGIWGQASELNPPPGAKISGGNAGENLALGMHSVTCTSLGDCVAVGQYYAKSSGYEGMVTTETKGVWGQASKLALPSGAEPKGQFAGLDSVACTSPGRCVAVGTYFAHHNTPSVMAVSSIGSGRRGRGRSGARGRS
ncbi:MAG: hypothetical protein WBV77_14685 [Solirubrobacteraceae bacterium]